MASFFSNLILDKVLSSKGAYTPWKMIELSKKAHTCAYSMFFKTTRLQEIVKSGFRGFTLTKKTQD